MAEILGMILKEVKEIPGLNLLAATLVGALIYKQGVDDQAERQKQS